jgi:hypothetical protein
LFGYCAAAGKLKAASTIRPTIRRGIERILFLLAYMSWGIAFSKIEYLRAGPNYPNQTTKRKNILRSVSCPYWLSGIAPKHTFCRRPTYHISRVRAAPVIRESWQSLSSTIQSRAAAP